MKLTQSFVAINRLATLDCVGFALCNDKVTYVWAFCLGCFCPVVDVNDNVNGNVQRQGVCYGKA